MQWASSGLENIIQRPEFRGLVRQEWNIPSVVNMEVRLGVETLRTLQRGSMLAQHLLARTYRVHGLTTSLQGYRLAQLNLVLMYQAEVLISTKRKFSKCCKLWYFQRGSCTILNSICPSLVCLSLEGRFSSGLAETRFWRGSESAAPMMTNRWVKSYLAGESPCLLKLEASETSPWETPNSTWLKGRKI